MHDLARHAFGFTKGGFVVALSVHRWNGLCYLASLGFTTRREDDAYTGGIKGDGKEGRKVSRGTLARKGRGLGGHDSFTS